MSRPRGGCLALIAVLLCAGCVVANPTPGRPTAALITATAPLSATLPPASATALTIVTATPSNTGGPSATLPPLLPSTTPLAAETITAAPPSATPPASASPVVTPPPTLPPTVPPAATALPVGISLFSISPQIINPGESITLTWQATGEQAAIYRLEPGGPLTDMHTVPLTGTLTLKTPDGLRNRVEYVLYAGAGGSTASASVSAVIRCPDKYFFANPPAGCPLGPGALVPMAAERFQHGEMIWLSGQDQIYILFGDGGNPAWLTTPNAWFQGQPESDPSLVPPAGLFQPVRGFGLAWRANDVLFGQTVRDRLGWATEAESPLTGSYQCDSMPKYNHCYLSGPGGVIYHLRPERSGWDVWQGP